MKIFLCVLTAFVGICLYAHHALSQQPVSELPAVELVAPTQTLPAAVQSPVEGQPIQVDDQESLEKAIADLQRQIQELKAQNLKLQQSTGIQQPTAPVEVARPPIPAPPVVEQVIPHTVIPQQTYQPPIVVEQPIYQVPQYCPNSFYRPSVGFYGGGFGGFGYGGLGISVGRLNLDIPFGPGFYGHSHGHYNRGGNRGNHHGHKHRH